MATMKRIAIAASVALPALEFAGTGLAQGRNDATNAEAAGAAKAAGAAQAAGTPTTAAATKKATPHSHVHEKTGVAPPPVDPATAGGTKPSVDKKKLHSHPRDAK
jgi:hypothetical protein